MMAAMPVRDTIPPEALLDDFPPPMQAIAHRLREIVIAAIPDAIERVRPGWRLIGYDLPIRKNGVYFAYVAPEFEHVHLGFEHGWAMQDPDGVLQGEGITKQVRWLTFRPGDDDRRRPVRSAGPRGGPCRRDDPGRARPARDGRGDRADLGRGRRVGPLVALGALGDGGDPFRPRLGPLRLDDPLQHRPSRAP